MSVQEKNAQTRRRTSAGRGVAGNGASDDAKSGAADTTAGKSSDAGGLTETEAAKRLAQYGENALAEHHVSRFRAPCSVLLGSDPLDDRDRGGALGRA